MFRRVFRVIIAAKPYITHYDCNPLLAAKTSSYCNIKFYSGEHFENVANANQFDSNESDTNVDGDHSGGVDRQKYDKTNLDTNQLKQFCAERAKTFWKEHNITVHGRGAPLPVFDFHDCEWPEQIMSALETDRFEKPTPIQSQGWPIVLSGRDMVGIAQTGSGKTLCYVLPAFVKIKREGTQRGPKCLVLAPTRELAQQIITVVKRYKFTNSVCLYGGASRIPQINAIRQVNPQIIVATPGRMNDFIESSVLNMSTIDYLVLDEADRMLDMGFEPQIRRILNHIPTQRQTLMWSATWPKEVRSLAAEFLSDFIQITIGGTSLTANRNIKQFVEICDTNEKFFKLLEILKRYPQESQGQNKMLIFTKMKRTADYLMHSLKSRGKRVMSLHSDKSQAQRDMVLSEFRKGTAAILCATDVAARGLDVTDIQVVVNYDFPNTIEDYIHRIGRTGRHENIGASYTLMTSEDSSQALDLIQVLKDAGQEVPKQLNELAGGPFVSRQIRKREWGYRPKDGDTFNRSQNYGFNRQQTQNRRRNFDDEDFDPFDDDMHSFNRKDRYRKDLYKKNYSLNSSKRSDDFDI